MKSSKKVWLSKERKALKHIEVQRGKEYVKAPKREEFYCKTLETE